MVLSSVGFHFKLRLLSVVRGFLFVMTIYESVNLAENRLLCFSFLINK